ncbi:axonemal dynein light intermediate polypeptide 1-like [Anguilla anguilla]|uniref:axonemal dynein light intermediate polypeptide 1-like n=1 Tax=Anguilla anguilla TaxID=7936 RepID=UPI0015AFC80C|nr:axonemal dynein light intermediate polypeptide 1-like [Anguilla anguilla]
MIPTADSLLQYDNPVLVSKKSPQPAGSSPALTPSKPKSLALEINREKTEDILHAILPPRVWSEGSKLWVQSVSSTPGTRIDVIKLQELLDLKLQQRQARETGICPIRRELYTQCFDELIRQETISCTERGLLLLRVRNEIRMCMAAYQTLYESSVGFGIRKVLQSEIGKAELERKRQTLEKDKRDLEQQVKDTWAKCEAIKIREMERREAEDRKHAEEIEFLKRTNQQLKFQLAGITQKK